MTRDARLVLATLTLISVAGCRASTPAERSPTLPLPPIPGAMAGSGADVREAIVVPQAQRAMLLAEMRGLLTSVNGVLRGLAAGDTAMMRANAAAGGMAAMQQQHRAARMEMPELGTGPMAAMPEGFRMLGRSVHMGFDSLATSISAGAGRDAVVQRLATLTTRCVSCHAAYRLVPADGH